MEWNCGNCKNCEPNDVCNGDCICTARNIEVSQDDDICFYGDESNKPCISFDKTS